MLFHVLRQDWDEDAPAQIVDPDATKPEAWLDDAPDKVPNMATCTARTLIWQLARHATVDGNCPARRPRTLIWQVPDPEAKAPDDWDAEEDGEWEAPLIDNPACKPPGGCGEWTPPKISNPDYKGKW